MSMLAGIIDSGTSITLMTVGLLNGSLSLWFSNTILWYKLFYIFSQDILNFIISLYHYPVMVWSSDGTMFACIAEIFLSARPRNFPASAHFDLFSCTFLESFANCLAFGLNVKRSCSTLLANICESIWSLTSKISPSGLSLFAYVWYNFYCSFLIFYIIHYTIPVMDLFYLALEQIWPLYNQLANLFSLFWLQPVLNRSTSSKLYLCWHGLAILPFR